MTYQQLLDKIGEIKIECEDDLEKIDEVLEANNIEFKSELDIVFDSCGLDGYAYAYAFMYEGEIRLLTGAYCI